MNSEQLTEGLKQMGIPLDEEELETLVFSVDFDGDDKIRYCEPPQLLRCYGGSLQEMVNTGLERVMINHRQDIAEIEEQHATKVAAIKLGADKPPSPVDGGDEAADSMAA